MMKYPLINLNLVLLYISSKNFVKKRCTKQSYYMYRNLTHFMIITLVVSYVLCVTRKNYKLVFYFYRKTSIIYKSWLRKPLLSVTTTSDMLACDGYYKNNFERRRELRLHLRAATTFSFLLIK